MISFFANIFGYILNFLYNLVNNYGLAIILFSIIIKLIMVPISIKQQKTMKKSAKLQEKMKQIQFKYKNDQEKLNQETMALYKREKMSPFSGCLSAIIQIILLFSVFYMVRQPLTYMKKIDKIYVNNIKMSENSQENQQTQETETESTEKITLIDYYKNKLEKENGNTNKGYAEIEIINKYGQEDDRVNLNMNFLGLDLSKIPTADAKDYKVWIIPVLYVISSILSMKITNKMQKSMQTKEVEKEEKESEENPMDQANKSMSLLMPVMSVSIAIVAPLGMALYWLLNNILMILERLILNKIIKDDEEETENV